MNDYERMVLSYAVSLPNGTEPIPIISTQRETTCKYFMSSLITQISEATEYVQHRIRHRPQIGLILGTGLGALADEIESTLSLPYGEIPYFPVSTVSFHAGRLVAGHLEGKNVVAMQGRFHYYEGYSMQQITLPVRVMRKLGIESLIVTNAVGGLRSDLKPATLLLVTDHINFMGDNPLLGPYDESLGDRFPDMSEPYSLRLQDIARSVAKREGIRLAEGVYAAVSGPSFETAAELRMLQTIGADTVGMSVVPEVLVARQMGVECLGLNVITDVSLPDSMVKVSHEEVSRVAHEIGPDFVRLVKGIIAKI